MGEDMDSGQEFEPFPTDLQKGIGAKDGDRLGKRILLFPRTFGKHVFTPDFLDWVKRPDRKFPARLSFRRWHC
jgi:hypothetical protein